MALKLAHHFDGTGKILEAFCTPSWAPIMLTTGWKFQRLEDLTAEHSSTKVQGCQVSELQQRLSSSIPRKA